MVIQENSPVDCGVQLSDWDKMISLQFKKSQAAMINNLVGDTSNTSKPTHTKNKQSTQSEHPQ